MNDKKRRYSVVITGPSITEKGMKLLEQKCNVICTEPYLPTKELAIIMQQNKADGLLVRMGIIDETVIGASSNLKVIAKHGTGVDNIDIKSATLHKIPVLITPYANYESVAEHILLFMLALAKNLTCLDSRMRKGFWDKPKYHGTELKNKTLGLVGFGKIGKRICELVKPFEMEIYIFDPFVKSSAVPKGIRKVTDLDNLLKYSDIVSINCPLTEKTRNLINKNSFAIMKKTSWLINTSRGGVVDEKSLANALEKNEIAAAAIDTFAKEPIDNTNMLCKFENIILTPHIAGITNESFERMGTEAAKNILGVLVGESPDLESLINPEFESTN